VVREGIGLSGVIQKNDPPAARRRIDTLVDKGELRFAHPHTSFSSLFHCELNAGIIFFTALEVMAVDSLIKAICNTEGSASD